jgi:cysteine-rich repeat protein
MVLIAARPRRVSLPVLALGSLGVLALSACGGGGSASSGSGGAGASSSSTSSNGTSSSGSGGAGAQGGGGATGGHAAGGGAPALCGNGVSEPGEECDDGNGSAADGCAPTCTKQVPMSEQAYPKSNEDFPNPERGFFRQVDLLAGAPEALDVKAQGLTLAYAPAHLDAYRDKPLDASLLDKLHGGLGAVRAAGIKVTLRFVYNDGFDPDATKARVLEHIEQVKPLLAEDADVIAAFQAGFIGAWGEWHSSTNGLDTKDNRQDILLAFLDAVPSSRSVQIRTPMFKDAIFPGGPLSAAAAFDGSEKARTGHHNDCFLASDDDVGTYAAPVATWKAYVAEEGRYVPVGGETCGVHAPRTDCPSALAEMSALHFSFLNALYHPDVLAGWAQQGCMEEIQRRLGYRLVLESASWSEKVAPGGALGVKLSLHNEGFAAPFNRRPLYLVLGEGASRRAAVVSKVDLRRWESGTAVKLEAWLRVPSDLAPGSYRLSLWMPDEAPGLMADPDYALRLGSEGVWDATTGENVLTKALVVDDSAVGAVVSGVGELVEIL